MSDTIVDMPKVAEMFDAGWQVRMFKNEMGSYTVEAQHTKAGHAAAVQDKLIAAAPAESRELVRDAFDNRYTIDTDDFTPEQALTRMAYKVFGEII